jgi:predicted exporter
MLSTDRRLLALECATPAEQPVALILLQTEGRDPESITGIAWMDMPRKDGEVFAAYVARVEAWLRATRASSLPAVCIAEYTEDGQTN